MTLHPTDIMAKCARILEERQGDYGDFHEFTTLLARRWSKIAGVHVAPSQALEMLAELKLQRLAENPCHEDSLIDYLNYTAMAFIARRRENPANA